MAHFSRVTSAIVAAAAFFATVPAPAGAATIRVPQDAATIQAAVDAAANGDEVRVGPGSWCGATVTKPLDLVGDGRATIVGCASPALFGLLRIGFFLPTTAASGTTIRNFVFDGRGTSNTNLDPLAFAVFARDADQIAVQGNAIFGTIQAITDTRGDGWLVTHNVIDGLSALTCDGFCGGGDGIVFQERTGVSRGRGNTAMFNVITGFIPNGLDEFAMTGILALNQDGVRIANNRIAIPHNPAALAAGEAIEINDHCCGVPVSYLTTINAEITNNDGRSSDFVLVIENDALGGDGNSEGARLRGNLGENDINGVSSSIRNRSVKTLAIYP